MTQMIPKAHIVIVSTHSLSMMVRIWRTTDMFDMPKEMTRAILYHSIRRKLMLKERGPRVAAMKPPTPRLVTTWARL